MSAPKPSFTTDLQQAIEASLLSLVRKGDWLVLDYQRRVQVPVERLREIYEAINFDRVKALCIERAEERIADAYMNTMATEIATDVKHILSNRELREDLRSIIRAKIKAAAAAVTKDGGAA